MKVKRFFPLAGILLLLVSVTSCASKKSEEVVLRPVFVTNSQTVQILPATVMEMELDYLYHLQVGTKEQTFSLMALTFAGPGYIELSLFNDFGHEMGYLSYGPEGVFLDCNVLPKALYAEFLINDLQLAWYPFEDISSNFRSSKKLWVEAEKTDSGSIRRVYKKKNLIEEVIITTNENGDPEYEIINHKRGYRFTFTEPQSME